MSNEADIADASASRSGWPVGSQRGACHGQKSAKMLVNELILSQLHWESEIAC
jgi:hypothetical protein